jgi:dTDP-4-amino-4,6-dideoxygalactose transaminase
LGTWFSSVLEEADAPTCGDYEMGSCPRAEEAARHLVNLPTNPRVNEQDVEAIVAALVDAQTREKRESLSLSSS